MLTALLYVVFAASPEPIPVQRPNAAPATPIAEGPQLPPISAPEAENAPSPEPAPAAAVAPAPTPAPDRAPEPASDPAPTNANTMQAARDAASAEQPIPLGMGDPAAPSPPVFEPVGSPPPADYVRVREPPLHGSGLIGVGVGALGLSVVMQGVWAGTCGDPFCDLPGIHERLLIAGGLVFITGGAYTRGKWNAYRDTLAGSPMSPARLRAHKIAGWTLAGAGLVALGTDFAFHTQCAVANRGPNVNGIEETAWGGQFVDCKGWASAAVMNISGAMAATGLGLAVHATKYERDRRFFRDAHIAAAPSFGRDYVGVGVSGRF